MVRQLKSIIQQGIRHQGTISVINTVIEEKNGHTVQDPAVREMLNDLKEFYRRRGASMMEESKAKPEEQRKYSKDLLTDEEFESVSVWIKTEPDATDASSTKDKEAETRFNQYVHHQYIRKWGLLTEALGKDEDWWIPNPPVLDENDSDYLCDMCRHIDFRALLTQRGLPGNELPGPTKITLHGLDQILQRERCVFCRLVSRKIRYDRILEFENEDAMKLTDVRLNVLDDGPENALRLEIELEDRLRLPEIQRIVIQRVDVEDPNPFNGILVNQEKVSIDAVRKWMNFCQHTHPKITDRCIEQRQPRLRLIDVEEKRVVEVECPCAYVCLSYVWGQINQPQYNSKTKIAFESPDGLSQRSIGLPQTITDAMIVTRQLGMRYLWVDALCIQQDNEEDKASIIANMGAIYSNATVTIVASTNSDPSEGLSGVTTKHRDKEQICERVQGMLLAVAFHDHRKRLKDMENSVWNSRAWTYQERHLSQRTLYFTDSQACMICPHATFLEDTSPSLDPKFRPAPAEDKTNFYSRPQDIQFRIWSDLTQSHFPSKGFQTDDCIMVMIGEDREDGDELSVPVYQYKQHPNSDTSGMPEIGGKNLWDTYRTAVDAYTRRNMSSETDAVVAFEGMAELISQGANTQFWYGVPAFAFDQALLWYPQEPLQRRRQSEHDLFPSWSWAGWKGHCHYRGRNWYNGLYRCPVSAVHWLRDMTPREFLEKHKDNNMIGRRPDKSKEEIEEEILNGQWTLVEQLNSYQLYRFDFEQDGWDVRFDTEKNQHAYIHEQYPGVFFNYPVPLPDQELMVIPDEAGVIRFQAHTNKVRFCDMRTTDFVQQFGVDQFLQIGLGDEDRSANYRPPWQRIIYHQGYRAGFLMLNIPFDDVDLEDQEGYSLVAMSRDELPRIPPPREPWEVYRMLGPVELHWNLARKEQWIPEKLNQTIVPPNETVTPDVSPKPENGDAIWDEYRFNNDAIYPLYNVLLIQKRGKLSERIGVGKIHYHAFHHARPEMSVILLK